jgi:hypothetical protein
MTHQQTIERSETTSPGAPRSGGMNRLAVWGFVLALLTLGGIGSVLGVVMGVKARGQVQRDGGRGLGLATAAIVIGILTFIGAIAYWIVIAKHFGGGSGGGSNGGTGGGGY